MNPYEVLQIPPTATQAEIRRAYRAMALATHPDRNPDDVMAGEKFRRVREAYEAVKGGVNPFARFGPMAGATLDADIVWGIFRSAFDTLLNQSGRPTTSATRVTPDQPGHPDYFK